MPEIDRDDIESRVRRSLALLLKHDKFLLEVDVNERSITHKLAEYLQAEFPEWHVDCEYNRRGALPKRLQIAADTPVRADDTEAQTVYPDIIVHRRNTDENLLVIEVKKSSNCNRAAWDRQKLEAFKEADDYSYDYAVFLKFETRSGQELGVSELLFL
ncbi:MAG: hypothetical protein HY651_09095 [Acidobacteria bacterium]|nr:hypothetical protein [Acidobacteriota bacterium]